jgi:hypothetical protein
MFQHGPTCLKGPRSRKRTQWRRPIETQDDISFRADLVARIRREIAEGTYDTEEKFEIALDRLLDRLERE